MCFTGVYDMSEADDSTELAEVRSRSAYSDQGS